ncbi:MAG: PIG-L family deacetylase [Nanoarchaeota archaeon]|nr:PIG-L family deacetylase [Nanoarchaeota archaeon]
MKLLVLTAHPDDEITCLGMIEKAKKENGEVLIICFTAQNETRIKEFNASCEFLGIKGINLGLEDGSLHLSAEKSQELINKIKEFKPSVVICQSDIDYHPDHKKVNAIAQDVVEFARHNKACEIKEFMKWESTNLFSYPDYILEISDEIIEKKKKLWEIHASQIANEKDKNYYLNFLEARARLRGIQIGKKYGEAYMRIPLPIHGDFY